MTITKDQSDNLTYETPEAKARKMINKAMKSGDKK
jgi:hypothetical protein